MIDPRFVFLAMAVSMVGAWGYIRDTLRGLTSPNRVTWGLWTVEGFLAFFVEVQEHVGLPALMTLTFGIVPLIVLLASFRHSHLAWKIGKFDIFCAAVSVLGVVFWLFVGQATVALLSFVGADQVAALPTLRKSWIAPATETARTFFLGSVNCTITLMALRHFTTAGALFPGCILVTDFFIGVLVVTRIGPRLRGDAVPSTPQRLAGT